MTLEDVDVWQFIARCPKRRALIKYCFYRLFDSIDYDVMQFAQNFRQRSAYASDDTWVCIRGVRP